jgi:predicted ABC-type ATPase
MDTFPELSTEEIYTIFTKHSILHTKPLAIITMGIPGSGKSTIVKQFITNTLSKIIPGSYKFKDFVNCNPDEILPYINDSDEKSRLAKAARKNGSILKKIREAENKLSVIYDGTGVNLPAYKGNINKFHDNGYFTILIYVKTNILVAKNRVKKRSRKVPAKDIQRIHDDLEEPIKDTNIKKFDYYKDMIIKKKGVYLVVDNTFKSKLIETNVSKLTL